MCKHAYLVVWIRRIVSKVGALSARERVNQRLKQSNRTVVVLLRQQHLLFDFGLDIDSY